ncbi:MAG: amino acid adenylation domain-containing protein [Bacilli bacterium]|nr:amino acid adenylation domain-containing protein [Bacilli bacterium]
MEKNMVLISPEELGIYLSCLQPTLAYNLPLLLPLGKKADFQKAKAAVDAILTRHPYLNMRLTQGKDGDIYKFIAEEPFELVEEKVAKLDKAALVERFDLLDSRLFRIRYLVAEDGAYLFSDFHHVLMDGFSLKKYLDEFASLYEGGKPGKPEEFDALMDAKRKAEYRADEAKFDADRDYFKEVFGPVDVDSSLIEDKKEEAVRYGRFEMDLAKLNDNDVAKALKKYGVRRSSFFLAAYSLALAQATFLDETLFLTVNNGRTPEVKDSFGMFVKTLPFYVGGLNQGPVADLLSRVDQEQATSIAHSAYSYSDVVSELKLTAENLFAYQGDYYYHLTLNGTDVPVEVIETADGKEKLAIELFRRGENFLVHAEYRADLYDEDSVRALVRRVEHFALELLQKDNLEDLDPCDEEDLRIVGSFNEDKMKGYDIEHDIADDIRLHIKQRPNEWAMVSGEKKLTYAELDDVSGRIADYIMKQGLKPNEVVSLLIKRTLDMPLSMVGAVFAGVGYQPLDPSYPDERLNFMITDADAKLLIADRDLIDRITDYHGPVLFTDEIPSLPKLDLPRPKYQGDDLFIMLYTSGSTGKPKGVQLIRRNISTFMQFSRKRFELEPGSRYFAYASFGFDASMFDVYNALSSGSTLYVIDEEMRLDLKRCADYFEENKITHGFMTTQVARQFAEDYDCPSLRYLITGGEKLVPVDPPRFTLCNAYGPTECTICVTVQDVDKSYHRVPIGQGFPINKLYVLDKKMRPLPYGVPGFLYVAGPQVARGYKNRPEENAKAFMDNPFEGGMWQKMYYTGDVVRFLKSGVVDFVGRKDGQVKIRGFRIEMSEVERVIRDFPGVKNATVNAYPAPSGGSFLAAYVVGDEQLDLEAIKAFVLERKPPYMVPEAMMQLDDIPLNQNGKVNRRALPVPSFDSLQEHVAPENEKEQSLFEVAKKILGYDVSVTADLYQAGLTSISSIKFLTLAAETLGVDLTLATLRENPTIRALAALSADEDVTFDENLADYPLTMTQEGIYVECFSHPDSTIYNIPLLYKLDQNVDLDRLQKAMETAIDAHPYLKGYLKVNEAGNPRMVPCLKNKVDVKRIKEDPTMPFALTPYDLLKGPFYQARIYEGKERYLFLDTHHIASDGFSLSVLLEDIEKAYRGEQIEAEKRDGFARALKEEHDATKEAKEKQKAYYASFLEGVDCVALPRKEYDLPKEEYPCEADHLLTVNKDTVYQYLKKNGLNLNGFFNAVFAYALAKWDGNEDALFTSIFSGRDSSSVSRTVTMLVKTLPAYAKADPNQATLEFIKGLSDQLSKSQQQTLFSFAEISHEFGVKADVMFAYQGDGFLPDTIGGHKAELIHLNGDEVKANFSVDCLETEDGFKLHFEYPSNLYREETMKYFSRLFDCVAKGFLTAKTLGDINLCDETTAKEMDVHNMTDDPILHRTYIDAFLEQVALHPDKKAVIGIDETLTYAELDARMNQVAHAIISRGLGKDDKVVVMMPRIANCYVAREGVLKGGACFVPVDPAYPDERILYIIEDSEAKFVLTTKELAEQKKAAFGKTDFLLIEDILASEPKDAVNVHIDDDALAYCIFTSGSTGKPKGVMIEHHSLANLVSNTPHNYVADEYANRSSVAVSLASLSFDLSIQEEYVPLANGLTVMIASEDEILNPVALAKRMKENHVDVLTTTPSYVNNVLDIEDVMVAFRDLKILDLGAEAIPATMLSKMRERGMNARLGNGYGPTEATVTCTFDVVESSRITIGYPDNNVKTYIIDEKGRRLPFGATGELLIGGQGVARGYVHRDELTKEKFINFDGVYAYRSGDLARINYDGRIEFFGRKDNQVKLRGLRVELDEIENALQSYPGISRAVVVVKETKEEGQFLVGYYLAKEEFDAASIKEHISKTLTPYMIPKVLMHLDTIPMTNNGKVNKKALPDPVVTKEAKRGVRLPKNETQQAIYDIFKHVLGVEELSIDDDFFDLGGTSLSASKVTMLALNKGLNISYSDVFDNPTVIDLAALLNAAKKTEVKEETIEEVAEGLEYNSSAYVDGITEDISNFKSILLTGATGFLGIHILHELLEHSDATVYALVRGSEGITGQLRLQGLLEYYFDNPYDEAFAQRVHVVESDVTSDSLLDTLREIPFELIVNCAAVVKHFSNSDAIERVNLGGVKNLIEVALDHKARLVQVSTLSVAGENVGGKFPKERRIHENEIFFGQSVENKYINSKIKAEEALIDAVNKRGLDGKIVRVGNLMGRSRDGEFQVNSGTNNFMASIRAYKKLGVFPVSAADVTIDFSPIDEVAKTILLLAKTSKRFTIFHSANSHEVEFGDVIAAMNDFGYSIKMVNDAEFSAKLAEFMADETKNMDVSSLISYNSSDVVTREYILSDNAFSVKALYRLGYKWPITDAKYLARSISSLSTLGFFE